MFGIRYIKVPPTTHVIQYRRGTMARQGAGLSFFYYAPWSSTAAQSPDSRRPGNVLTWLWADGVGGT